MSEKTNQTEKKVPTPEIIRHGEVRNGRLSRYYGKKSELVIPDDITDIAEEAFRGNTHVTRLVLGHRVATIGPRAFQDCTNLLQVIFPTGLRQIGDQAFEGCTAMTALLLPRSVVSLGDSCFKGCTALRHVVLSASIEHIGRYAFSDCESLEELTLPEGITTLHRCTFLTADPSNPSTFPKAYAHWAAISLLVVPLCVRSISVTRSCMSASAHSAIAIRSRAFICPPPFVQSATIPSLAAQTSKR